MNVSHLGFQKWIWCICFLPICSSISICTFFLTSGCKHMNNNAHLTAVAVVSVPARYMLYVKTGAFLSVSTRLITLVYISFHPWHCQICITLYRRSKLIRSQWLCYTIKVQNCYFIMLCNGIYPTLRNLYTAKSSLTHTFHSSVKNQRCLASPCWCGK